MFEFMVCSDISSSRKWALPGVFARAFSLRSCFATWCLRLTNWREAFLSVPEVLRHDSDTPVTHSVFLEMQGPVPGELRRPASSQGPAQRSLAQGPALLVLGRDLHPAMSTRLQRPCPR